MPCLPLYSTAVPGQGGHRGWRWRSPPRLVVELGLEHVLHVVEVDDDHASEDMNVDDPRGHLADDAGVPTIVAQSLGFT